MDTDQHLDSFLTWAVLVGNLSANTVSAYRRDLIEAADFQVILSLRIPRHWVSGCSTC